MEAYVTLEEILSAREERVVRQRALLARYAAPLVCLTMNIPGPHKLLAGVEEGFALALGRVERALEDHGAPVLWRESHVRVTGCEAYLAVDAPPAALKGWMEEIEEADPLGRLLDLDVLTVAGEKLSRHSPRRCLLCQRQAQACARSRTHSVEELAARIGEILREALS